MNNLKEITIRFVSNVKMRYETQGDWRLDENGNLLIEVIHTPDERYEQLVALHELIEALTCIQNNHSPAHAQGIVDKWDFKCVKKGIDDPGLESKAPYHSEHLLATGIENIIASVWGVKWKEYEKTLEKYERA